MPKSARSHCSTVCVCCESYLKEQSKCSSNSPLNKKTQDASQVTLSVHSTFPLSTQHIPLPCPLPGNNAPEYTVNHTMHQKTLSIRQCTRIHCQSHNAPENTVNQCTRKHCQSHNAPEYTVNQCTRIHCQSHNVPEYTVNHTMYQNTLSVNAPENTVNRTMHQNTLSIAQCLLHQKTLSITQCLLHKYINKTLLINLPCQSFG